MYKVMIVDDERTIRQGLKTVVDWAALGLEVVAEAANGRDGVNQALICRPDIVLTDVRMPVMDGIEMAKRLLAQPAETRIIMLSGYDDFAYVRAALHLGAADYLLKPVAVAELSAVLAQTVQTLQADQARQAADKQARKRLDSLQPTLKGEFLKAYVTKQLTLAEFAARGPAEYGFQLTGEQYQILRFEFDDGWQLQADREEAGTLQFALANIAGEVLAKAAQPTTCYLADSAVLVLLALPAGVSERAVIEACREVQYHISQFYAKTITVGVGSRVERLTDLVESYESAALALKQKVREGKSKIFANARPAAVDAEMSPVLSKTDAEAFRTTCQLRHVAETEQALNELFEKYVRTCDERQVIRYFSLSLYTVLRQELEKAFRESETLAKCRPAELERLETTAEMKAWLLNVYEHAVRALDQIRNTRFSVQESIAYAKAHYAERIRIEDLSSRAEVTPNYFSRLFKEETGTTFIEWLNQYRIGEALRLMKQNPTLKSYQIADCVGFQDYKYFTFVFKKQTGYSPSAYRKTFELL